MLVCGFSTKHRTSLAKSTDFLSNWPVFGPYGLSCMVRGKFKKSSNKSRKVCFMFPFHLPVFINQLDLRFVKEALKTVIKCIWKFVKTATPISSPAFHTLKFQTKHFILILCEVWKDPDGWICRNLNAFFRTAMIELASDRLSSYIFLNFAI